MKSIKHFHRLADEALCGVIGGASTKFSFINLNKPGKVHVVSSNAKKGIINAAEMSGKKAFEN